MPLDKSGKFRNSTQRAIAADKASGSKKTPSMTDTPPVAEATPEPEQEENGGHTIFPHGDGTFHSVSADGERTEHPHAGHAAAHFMSKQDEGGPQDDIELEELGEALKRFFDEQAQERF